MSCMFFVPVPATGSRHVILGEETEMFFVLSHLLSFISNQTSLTFEITRPHCAVKHFLFWPGMNSLQLKFLYVCEEMSCAGFSVLKTSRTFPLSSL